MLSKILPIRRNSMPGLLITFTAVSVGVWSWAASADEPPYQPKIEKASGDAQQAIKSFRLAPGVKAELYAAEPMLANPVAFGVDERNRFFVCETFRHHAGVTDIRGHMDWLDDDLASRTVGDRVAMYRKHMTPEEFAKYGVEHDRIRLLEDRDGDHKADHSVVFAEGFKTTEAGIGAGVLVRDGRVYYTCIPDLWLLKDINGDGVADERTSLFTGFGVHVGFLGHDLHGLIIGNDGRLYFTIGDRGSSVQTREGKTIDLPDTGCVLRCELDGSKLEIVHKGLRNPQELAFDARGNLFTVDNNSDGGDRARLVYIVEGGDSGWRIGYQFLEKPTSRGPWNAERIWYPAWDGQAAFLVPPLINFTDGPSGLTYNPGASLLPESLNDTFFICDFRGSSGQSGVRSFQVTPKGASFELTNPQQFAWGMEATDVDFGTDGAIYIADWVEGWAQTGKGRLYRLFDPAKVEDPVARGTGRLLAEGFDHRPAEELVKLLSHADMRIRQRAQFALVAKGGNAVQLLTVAAGWQGSEFGRLHAVWGLGQLARANNEEARKSLILLKNSEDREVAAQAIKALGEVAGTTEAELLAFLFDRRGEKVAPPREQFIVLQALAKVAPLSDNAVHNVARLLRQNEGDDPYIRHAAVMAIANAKNSQVLDTLADDPDRKVRMAALLAYRRLKEPNIAKFLKYGDDPGMLAEAARAIYEVPIEGGMNELARRGASPPSNFRPLDLVWMRRAINAMARLRDQQPGDGAWASALATLAMNDLAPFTPIRLEAIELLGDWAKPSGRDPITGLWWPRAGGSSKPAAQAIAQVLASGQLKTGTLIRAAAKTAAKVGIEPEAVEPLVAIVKDKNMLNDTRAGALLALETLGDAIPDGVIDVAKSDENPQVRNIGLRLLSRTRPVEAVEGLAKELETGSVIGRQEALAALAKIEGEKCDDVLVRSIEQLAKGQVPPEVELDILEAVRQRKSSVLSERLKKFEESRAKDDPIGMFREALSGGNAARGEKVFREKTSAQCLKCHKYQGNGGEVGPELAGIGAKQPRVYLLESIVTPNKAIAEGFESVVIATADGQVVTGVLKGEDDKEIKIITAEGKPISIVKDQVDERKRGASAMPEDLIKNLTKSELRDLVEFLATSKTVAVGDGDRDR